MTSNKTDSCQTQTPAVGRAFSAAIAAALVISLSACGSQYAIKRPSTIQRPAPVPPVADRPAEPAVQDFPQDQTIRPTRSRPPEQEFRSLPAAVTLRQQADLATADNNHSRAIGLLERALRISPNDPQTFQSLAENHLALNRPQEALQLTRRALSLNPTTAQRSRLEQLQQNCEALL